MLLVFFLCVFSIDSPDLIKRAWYDRVLVPFKFLGGGIKNTKNFIVDVATAPVRAIKGVKDTVGALKSTAEAVKQLASKVDREVAKTSSNLKRTSSTIVKNLSKYRISAAIVASSIAALSAGTLYIKYRRAKHEHSLRMKI
jgi:hypothetical protein